MSRHIRELAQARKIAEEMRDKWAEREEIFRSLAKVDKYRKALVEITTAEDVCRMQEIAIEALE